MPNLLLNCHHNEVKVTLELHLKFHKLTLAAEIFGVGNFWLEFCPILDIQEPLTDFHSNGAKKKSFF